MPSKTAEANLNLPWMMSRFNRGKRLIKVWFQRNLTPRKNPAIQPDPLRLGLFSLDQLERHAKALAAKHEIAVGLAKDKLLGRLDENEVLMLKAYSMLSDAVQLKQQISPAGEWLLDNFHLIEEQIRISRRHLPKGYSLELPLLAHSNSSGYPRVYDIALELIAHVDGRVDKENITVFVNAYQQMSPLKLGEFWAIPIMIRLALIENLSRVAVHVTKGMQDRALANTWANALLHASENDPRSLILVAADMVRSNPPISNSFVAELVRRLRGQGPSLDISLSWIEQQLMDRGQSIQLLVQLESQEQAANQVEVGASIGSLRFLSTMDWRDFVESLSLVEKKLRLDPAKIYEKMDFHTRDHYRHVVESIAKKSGKTEWEVAHQAITMAKSDLQSDDPRNTHVGSYLIGPELSKLKIACKTRTTASDYFHPSNMKVPQFIYFSMALLVTASTTAALVYALQPAIHGWFDFSFFIVFLFLCSSQVAFSLLNWFTTLSVTPDQIPRLDFSKAIPSEFSSLVAIPTLLLNLNNVESLLDALEVRYLANRDENLYFALLTDFADAESQILPEDEGLIAAASQGIAALNKKYPQSHYDKFHILHRDRSWNNQEAVWMGHERKRGKLEALNSHLRQLSPDPLFSLIVGRLPFIKYVVTLDTDTQLPRDTARQMVSSMAHPLNHPFYDEKLGRVTKGYSILQPRIVTSLPSSRRSLFVRLYGGDTGIDPYTRSVSDVYQDLFFQGSFVGKGIYDVDALIKSLDKKLPNNLILSHDLLEGCYARSGLLSDVQLFEDFPFDYNDDIKRRARWIRGDWQIISWLFPWVPTFKGNFVKNPLSALSRWKIADNLRRSLLPIATLLLLLRSWLTFDEPSSLKILTVAVISILFLPQILTSLADSTRKASDIALIPHLQSVASSIFRHICQAALSLVFLPFESLVSLNSIGRSIYRMLVSRKRLLEWTSTSDPTYSSQSRASKLFRSMMIGPVVGLGLTGYFMVYGGKNFGFVYSFLALWSFSPFIAVTMSHLIKFKNIQLTDSQDKFLHRLGRKTWRFFETFVGPDENWLPPDNFQTYPVDVIAHRTSPTNMGLSLLANLSAFDFGYIAKDVLIERSLQGLKTMMGMERFKGHFYNWYDTLSLHPLNPLYVSTVDSGNLAGLLLTLNQGIKDLEQTPIIAPQLTSGLLATLYAMQESTVVSLENLETCLKRTPASIKSWMELQAELDSLCLSLDVGDNPETHWWWAKFKEQYQSGISDQIASWAPWLLNGILAHPPSDLARFESLHRQLDSLLTVTQQNESLAKSKALLEILETETLPFDPKWIESLRSAAQTVCDRSLSQSSAVNCIIQWADQLANFEYEFLYDRSQHLLAIGYNVTEHRRDSGFYDLLASEARLGSFVAIAQGHLPQDHWFALGRLVTTWNNHAALLSWSGSMFEYLMPLLVMPTFENTLLNQTYDTIVERQISYGAEHGVPWGISESGYNITDVHLNYQYRAFGVPGLGFKRGLVEDLVIAPYASVMAIMVAPRKACENLQRMEKEGLEGAFGFYEAVDYTPSRIPSGQTRAVVKSYMAHHAGMSFLSLANYFHKNLMQNRFLADPLMRATALLLHERVPKATRLYPHAPEVSTAQRLIADHEPDMRVIDTPNTSRPEIHLLSNGRYTVMITNSGGGYSNWKGLSLTRWREDPTLDNWGTFCYVRDVENGHVWSATHQPTLKKADHYEAIFPQARAEFRRRDDDLEMHTEITVSPEDDIELRRFSITNLSNRTRTIELTSYAEVVLVGSAVDEAHPAFSNLFVQTEIRPESQSILCTRRPRSDREKTPTLLHLMTVHGQVKGQASFETDRSSFIGRGNSIHEPAALRPGTEGSSLSGQQGSVLDPIVSIRQVIVIEPEQTARVHIVTGIAETKAQALTLIDKYHDRHVADRVFELAWTHRQVVLRQLNISEGDAQLYARLASSILYANPMRRPPSSLLSKNRRGQSGLWGYGISGDLPIILLRVGTEGRSEIVRQLIQAQGYWQTMGLAVDLVIWNEDDSGYRQDLNEWILELVAAASHLPQLERPGGVFVRRSEQMSEEDRILLQTVARAVLVDSEGSLSDQISRRRRVRGSLAALVPTEEVGTFEEEKNREILAEELIFANGTGGFSKDGKEYLIETSPEQRTPAPWSNVIANRFFGTVISESGSAYTWCENAHAFRLTPWHNDAISDASGEAFYIRDEETGVFWSPTPLPVRSPDRYLTRHGFGYSKFELSTQGIRSELTTFVAVDAPVKMAIIKLQNLSLSKRKISITGYCEWVLGTQRSKSLMHIVSEEDAMSGALFVKNPYHAEFGGRIAFFNVSERQRTVTCDRSEFIGRNGRLGNPAAMRLVGLSGKVGASLDSCSAMQTSFELEANEERELVFILGMARDQGDARTLLSRFCQPNEAQQALEEVHRHWDHTLGAVQIQTPDRSVNILTNGWLVYQTLACRVWARSGYYQSGGAFGFRDQLQDTMALIHCQPALLREHLLKCASRQYREGDVQHWWHPPSGMGVRTHFSDDYLWLPLATSRYVLALGDTGVLSERVNFIEGRQVKLDEEAYSDLPVISDESATLYEHCVRSIKYGMKYGRNGLPLIGCGDWNDGMNLIGEHGAGESVWLAFFFFDVLTRFAVVAEIHGDPDFALTCVSEAAKIKIHIDENGWDGEWYRRAYFDNGDPLGSAQNQECQIDSLPQTWSILSGAGDPERSQSAMAAVDRRLVDRNNKLVKLFDPPFNSSNMNPGYIKGYVPGVRENGGQYTHAAIWMAMALAAMKDNQRAWELLSLISPVNHGDSPEKVLTYKVEPYVVAADVYAVSPHVGRGGWTWYTGSSGWMYRLILESLLGIRLQVDRLYFEPCIPPEWTGFTIYYRYRETGYNISLQPSDHSENRITLDGTFLNESYLTLSDDRTDHQVEIMLAKAVVLTE